MPQPVPGVGERPTEQPPPGCAGSAAPPEQPPELDGGGGRFGALAAPGVGRGHTAQSEAESVSWPSRVRPSDCPAPGAP